MVHGSRHVGPVARRNGRGRAPTARGCGIVGVGGGIVGMPWVAAERVARPAGRTGGIHGRLARLAGTAGECSRCEGGSRGLDRRRTRFAGSWRGPLAGAMGNEHWRLGRGEGVPGIAKSPHGPLSGTRASFGAHPVAARRHFARERDHGISPGNRRHAGQAGDDRDGATRHGKRSAQLLCWSSWPWRKIDDPADAIPATTWRAPGPIPPNSAPLR